MHPFANAFRCELAAVEEVPVSAEHPTGIKFTSPCLCPCFMHVETRVAVEGSPGLVRDVRVSGCQANLFPWMQGQLILQSNKAAADAEKCTQSVEAASQVVARAALALAVRRQVELLEASPAVAGALG